jgi:hypothetical protein
MVLKEFIYFINGKKKTIRVKKVSIFSPGLLFRRSSTPLLFTLKRKKKFSIFSIFCRPFTAIWLDEDKNAIKILKIKDWRWNIPGEGKYLLEVPETTIK